MEKKISTEGAGYLDVINLVIKDSIQTHQSYIKQWVIPYLYQILPFQGINPSVTIPTILVERNRKASLVLPNESHDDIDVVVDDVIVRPLTSFNLEEQITIIEDIINEYSTQSI